MQKPTDPYAQATNAKKKVIELAQIVRDQQKEIVSLKRRLQDSQARTKELYLALRKVVTKDHPALRRKK